MVWYGEHLKYGLQSHMAQCNIYKMLVNESFAVINTLEMLGTFARTFAAINIVGIFN